MYAAAAAGDDVSLLATWIALMAGMEKRRLRKETCSKWIC
jgi:hypothetical protein